MSKELEEIEFLDGVISISKSPPPPPDLSPRFFLSRTFTNDQAEKPAPPHELITWEVDEAGKRGFVPLEQDPLFSSFSPTHTFSPRLDPQMTPRSKKSQNNTRKKSTNTQSLPHHKVRTKGFIN